MPAVSAAAAATPAAGTPLRTKQTTSQVHVAGHRPKPALSIETEILRVAIDKTSGVLAMTRADGSPAGADEVLNAVCT